MYTITLNSDIPVSKRKEIIKSMEEDGWKYLGTQHHIGGKLITLSFKITK